IRRKHHSFKYANYSGTTFAGVMSAMLAQRGYNAEQTCLDNAAFIRAQGCLASVDELLLEDLGKKWWITETAIKFYPSCRYTHGPIDMLTSLMTEEGLTADDIEQCTIFINPMGYALLFFREPAKSLDLDHCAPLSGAFNIPYVMALAALGRRPGPGWYSEESLQDPAVWSLASRFEVAPDEKGQREVVAALGEKIRRFRKTPASIVVKARGVEYRRSIEYVNGDPWSDETLATWEKVSRKFHQFCQDLISSGDIDHLIDQFRSLDSITHFRDEVDLLLVE
ncbi:MAG: MmgE/PrpD family protein, partial [Halioglobus sp.]|nr:MmgE/PrpD family protein [Halioglobus sp.]